MISWIVCATALTSGIFMAQTATLSGTSPEMADTLAISGSVASLALSTADVALVTIFDTKKPINQPVPHNKRGGSVWW